MITGLVRRARAEAGFTLIEVLAATVVITVLAAGVATALIAGNHLSANQRLASQGDQLAQQDQERLKGLSSDQLDALSGGSSRQVTLDGTTFTVTSQTQFINATGGPTCSTGAAAYYHTSSIVTAFNPATGTTQTVAQEDSVITPPAGGALLTQVNDQTKSPLSGVTVSATGPSDASATTDSTGCVVLAGLTPGNYTVALSDPGYVDPTGNPNPSSSATVTSTGTQTPGTNPLTMGLAGSINATFTTSAVTGNQGVASVSWLGTGSSKSMITPGTCVIPASTTSCNVAGPAPVTTPIILTDLFPFAFAGPSYTNNYQVWAGQCLQEQPPAGQDTTSVGPGANVTASFAEPALNVGVTWNGAETKPSYMKMTFTSATGTACTDTWYPAVASSYSAATGWLASPGQPFSSNATSGSSESASSYTGSTTVCAGYNGYYGTVSNVYNNNYSSATSVTVALTSSSSRTKC